LFATGYHEFSPGNGLVTPEKARLSPPSLETLPSGVARPLYDRLATRIGMVHFGPGVFHRTHQALYVERLLERDPRWAICGVSLRSTALEDELGPQQGLYTCAELSEVPRFQVVGSLREVLAARRHPGAVMARLTAPQTGVLTMTITEAGYCLTRDDELDFMRPEIAADLKTPEKPTSMVGWVVEALNRRRASGLAPFVTISCDNLVNNGATLRRAVIAFARARSSDLAKWIEDEARFPCTMVDTIAPATDAALRELVSSRLGVWDAAPVQHEPFSQWVIEDLGLKDGPDWAAAGATLSRNVDAYDQAKLRLLNGAHSSLAYLGLLAGHATIAEAMNDAALAAFVETMMRRDIEPSLRRSEIDLAAYISAILARFRNRGLVHTLAQIAYDGSQKLPYRFFSAITDALNTGRPIARLALPLAGWMRFVVVRARSAEKLIDPLAERLEQVAASCGGDDKADAERFLAMREIFPPALAADPVLRQAVIQSYSLLAQQGVAGALAALARE
jgi:fructuronate reductase